MDDHHAAPAEHETRAHQHGITDFLRHGERFGSGVRDAALRLQDADLFGKLLEVVAVFGEVDVVRARPDDVRARRPQALRQIERRLPAELDDHARARFAAVDVHDVFERERLEIQFVAGVVVGRNGLRVRVHHDDLVPGLPQRERRVTAAVVELDPLPDPVRTAAEDHDRLLFAAVADRFAGVVVTAVIVRRDRLELPGAGVHRAVHRRDPGGSFRARDVRLGRTEQERDLPVAVAQNLRLPEKRGIFGQFFEAAAGGDHVLERGQFREVAQEIAVDAGKAGDAVDLPAALERRPDVEDAVGGRHGKRVLEVGISGLLELRVVSVRTEPGAPGLERTQRLLQTLLEVAADGHDLADRLHLRTQRRVGGGEFLEREARDLRDHIVERGLETARGRAGDVVAEFVERVADRELGGDLGDRETGRLRGERARARHARVHFDDDAPPGLRLDRPLDVRPAGLDADRGEDLQRIVAHGLIFPVAQGLDRRHGDGVAGMHAHRVEVLDGADDHAAALAVAHDLHFEFLPAEERLFDEDFMVQARFEPAPDDDGEFLRIVRDAAAGAAQREAGADDERPAPDHLGDGLGFALGMRRARTRQVEPDRLHGLFEKLAVLRAADRVGGGADELEVVTLEDAFLLELHGEVQRGLAAERGQDRVRPFAPDDLVKNVASQRLDVRPVGELGVGHHGRRVRVHEHDLETVLLERFARLHAGIVELAPLTDDDRAGADEQDLLDVSAFRHDAPPCTRAPRRSARRRAGAPPAGGI